MKTANERGSKISAITNFQKSRVSTFNESSQTCVHNRPTTVPTISLQSHSSKPITIAAKGSYDHKFVQNSIVSAVDKKQESTFRLSGM